MAESWENAVKDTAQKLAEALKDAATLSVKTDYIEAAPPGGQQSTPITLTTTISLDADSVNSVPVVRVEGSGLQVDPALHQIHETNVQAAIDYRMRILNALLDLIKTQLR